MELKNMEKSKEKRNTNPWIGGRSIIFTVLCFLGGMAGAQTPDGAALLRLVDQAQTFDTQKSTGVMSITTALGTRKTSFVTYSRGRDETYMEFTSAAEKGQKILRNLKELYLFFPDAEEVTRLQGAALRQSMAGSDISYEDMTGTRNRSDNYTAVIEGSEVVDGRDCWKLVLTAKTRNVAYPKQTLWVDKSNNLPAKGEYFALSGRVMKRLGFSDVQRMGNYSISTRITVSDALRSGSQTELILGSIEINKPVNPRLFTLDNLSF